MFYICWLLDFFFREYEEDSGVWLHIVRSQKPSLAISHPDLKLLKIVWNSETWVAKFESSVCRTNFDLFLLEEPYLAMVRMFLMATEAVLILLLRWLQLIRWLCHTLTDRLTDWLNEGTIRVCWWPQDLENDSCGFQSLQKINYICEYDYGDTTVDFWWLCCRVCWWTQHQENTSCAFWAPPGKEASIPPQKTSFNW